MAVFSSLMLSCLDASNGVCVCVCVCVFVCVRACVLWADRAWYESHTRAHAQISNELQ